MLCNNQVLRSFRRLTLKPNWWGDVKLLGQIFHLLKRADHTFTACKPIRQNYPVVMKLDTPEFKAMFTPELVTLASLFKEYGYELRIAGGAVRDLLLNKEPKDLDFATTATPSQMKDMFNSEGIRMINTNGEKHGTITPRINDKENFEVTTLRIDVCTDGRHAEVQFTTDWRLDANRRDLTINSMFLDLDGTVYDYFCGFEDLQNRRVIFVGDASQRIQEDYLRILRYFRFFGRIAVEPDSHDQVTLEAIQDNVGGLNRISGERIWMELSKILAGNFAGPLVGKMLKLGIGPYIGLSPSPNIGAFNELWERSKHLNLQPMTLLAALLKSPEQVMTFHSRVKLSAFERDLGLFVVEHREAQSDCSNSIKPYQMVILNSSGKSVLVREWVREVLKYQGDAQLLTEWDQWKMPKFPVTGNMLRSHGVPGGKTMGLVMQKLKNYWFDNDFDVSCEELLKLIPDFLSELGPR